jgi:hypothetical protein
MGLQEIRQCIGKLWRRLLLGTTVNVQERRQIPESGSRAPACDQEQHQGPEPLFGMPRQVNGHASASSTSMQRKNESAANPSAGTGKCVCAVDIAREISECNSGAAIGNVLVVGTNGSTRHKRMKMHFNDPAQVPAAFNSLAAALKSNGFNLQTAWSSGMPATEIWLTSPLDDPKRTLLSCARPIGKQATTGIAGQSGVPREQTE